MYYDKDAIEHTCVWGIDLVTEQYGCKKCFIVISVASASVMPIWCSYRWAARISGKLGCFDTLKVLI